MQAIRLRTLRLSAAGVLAIVVAWVGPGCAPTLTASREPAPAGERVVLSLKAINCQSCGEASANAVRRLPGVFSARFDKSTVELAVRYDPRRIRPGAFVTRLRKVGYEAVIGAGQGAYSPEVVFPVGLDVAWLSRGGEAVGIGAHHVSGKVTVFDFYATWCGPCKEVDRAMIPILQARGDVALRKLDIGDWDSPLARQALKGVSGLPYVVVYDKAGRRVKAIDGLDLEALAAAIEEARR